MRTTKNCSNSQMKQKDINELERLDDCQQYPVARCDMNTEVEMYYMGSSSQMIEAIIVQTRE